MSRSEPGRRLDRLFLTGPMGSGKTTVGRQLARRLGLDFLDLDQELQRRCGVEVAVIFDIEGEAGFRQRESDLLDELSRRTGLLLATGGGSILDSGNRRLLQERGLVIYLRTSVDQQLRRLQRDRQRPLLQTPDRRERLIKMAATRSPLYASCAELIIDSLDTPPDVMAAHVEHKVRALWQEAQVR